MNKALWILMVLALSACGSTQVAYEPGPAMDRATALKSVERLLREQPGPYAPASVEVTDEYFLQNIIQLRSNMVFRKVPVPTTTSVYFDDVSDARVYLKDRLYVVLITDPAGAAIFRYWHRKQDRAQLFADAMLSLKSSQF